LSHQTTAADYTHYSRWVVCNPSKRSHIQTDMEMINGLSCSRIVNTSHKTLDLNSQGQKNMVELFFFQSTQVTAPFNLRW